MIIKKKRKGNQNQDLQDERMDRMKGKGERRKASADDADDADDADEKTKARAKPSGSRVTTPRDDGNLSHRGLVPM